MIVLALFGILAVAIAGVGIYGVMTYLVEQQTQESGAVSRSARAPRACWAWCSCGRRG